MPTLRLAVLGGGLGAFLLGGCAAAMPREPEARLALAEAVVDGWYQPCRLAARKLMDQYGAPDEVSAKRLAWKGRWPWKRVSVRDGELTDEDTVEHAVAYAVPVGKARALWAFSAGVEPTRLGNELTARSSSEARNILALNLADAVLKGRLTAREARGRYESKMALAAAGKTVPEMTGLLFRPEPF